MARRGGEREARDATTRATRATNGERCCCRSHCRSTRASASIERNRGPKLPLPRPTSTSLVQAGPPCACFGPHAALLCHSLPTLEARNQSARGRHIHSEVQWNTRGKEGRRAGSGRRSDTSKRERPTQRGERGRNPSRTKSRGRDLLQHGGWEAERGGEGEAANYKGAGALRSTLLHPRGN